MLSLRIALFILMGWSILGGLHEVSAETVEEELVQLRTEVRDYRGLVNEVIEQLKLLSTTLDQLKKLDKKNEAFKKKLPRLSKYELILKDWAENKETVSISGGSLSGNSSSEVSFIDKPYISINGTDGFDSSGGEAIFRSIAGTTQIRIGQTRGSGKVNEGTRDYSYYSGIDIYNGHHEGRNENGKIIYSGSSHEALEIRGSRFGGHLRTFNNLGKMAAFLGVDSLERGGQAVFFNTNQKRVTFIGANKSEGGHATFLNMRQEPVAFIGANSEQSGHAFFKNQSGKEVAYIGTGKNAQGRVEVQGQKVHDYAEIFSLVSRKGIIPGTVMSVSEIKAALKPSVVPYDSKVIGVISGAGGFQPGLVIGTRVDGTNDLPLAVSGQVYVRVCEENGPINLGDLLVSSSSAGIAMKATNYERGFGAIIGKALEPFNSQEGETEGLLRMLVMMR